MTDETADLDRLFARLSTEGGPGDPADHPAPEKLSAYQANELSPEEEDAIQEHLAHCTLCTGLLLDLQRFLDPPSEDRPREGVADFETAAEWRELREKLRVKAPTAVVRRSRLRKISAMQGFAAVLALFLVAMTIQIVVLERELAQPITDLKPKTTIEAQGGKKGAQGVAEPTPFRLGQVVAFDIHSSQPYARFRLIFRDEDGGGVRRVVEAPENEEGMIAMFLPRRFLAPGIYKVEVLGLDGPTSDLVKEFDIRILQ